MKIIICLMVLPVIYWQCSSPEHSRKTIVYINSYHQGHPSSDQIQEAFLQNMPADSFTIHHWYMDTKRNNEEQYIQTMAAQLLDSIHRYTPDLLVVSDDNAVKYIAEPNLAELKIPVVFCGVNWTATGYNLPRHQVTGILEILPVEDALALLRNVDSKAKKLFILNENTTTSRKEEPMLDTLLQRMGFAFKYKKVDNFTEWKDAFLEANQEDYDLIYLPTHASIKGWIEEEATAFVKQHIRKPVFTCEDFMMPYAVIGVTKVAAEHGEWAAQTAKKILAGDTPSAIEISRNKQFNTWLNPLLAKKIDFDAAEQPVDFIIYQ